MDFLHNDTVLKCAAAACAIAAVGAQYLPQNTLGWKICAGVVAIGVSLGIYSTTGRSAKVPAAPPGVEP